MRWWSNARRLLSLATLLGLFCSAALPLALQGRQEKKQSDTLLKDILGRKNIYHPPPTARNYSGKDKVVEVDLVVGMAVHAIDRAGNGRFAEMDFVRTRSYGCKLCGPVIRVKPGDLLKIQLRNDIRRTEPDTPYKEGTNEPFGFNVTNLHTHGLNVSPEGRSDNVFLEVGPQEHIDLCFDIHKGHTCGTFWYHAHKHGSVALQLAGGMAGVLIVDGGMDEVPEIAAAMKDGREKILVFQQLPYRPVAGKVVEVLAQDVYANPDEKDADIANGKLKTDTLINGEFKPTITMRPGEIQRWRCVHAGLESTLQLGLASKGTTNPADKDLLPLHEIAVDGLPLGEIRESPSVELQPGYRSDFLVEAPKTPGTYLLRSLPVGKARSFARKDQEQEFLATVKVEGDPVEMKLPKAKALEKYRLPCVWKVDKDTTTLKFLSVEGERDFSINGKTFDKNKFSIRPKMGTAEEWTLRSGGGLHPFHIHVNPFEVIGKDKDGKEQRTWRDTLLLSDLEGPVKVRMRFERYSGKTVLHCHNLRHEDQGMMAAIKIEGEGEGSRCPPPPPVGLAGVPVAAPSWELSDGTGMKKRADYKGTKVLLVFSRGGECIHCREQLVKLRENAKALKAAGLTVIVVCPVPAEKLGKQKFPDALLSDESLATFRKYGCFDGRALHGTFLIDTQGKVQWQNAGDEPYMNVAELLAEAKKLE